MNASKHKKLQADALAITREAGYGSLTEYMLACVPWQRREQRRGYIAPHEKLTPPMATVLEALRVSGKGCHKSWFSSNYTLSPLLYDAVEIKLAQEEETAKTKIADKVQSMLAGAHCHSLKEYAAVELPWKVLREYSCEMVFVEPWRLSENAEIRRAELSILDALTADGMLCKPIMGRYAGCYVAHETLSALVVGTKQTYDTFVARFAQAGRTTDTVKSR